MGYESDRLMTVTEVDGRRAADWAFLGTTGATVGGGAGGVAIFFGAGGLGFY